ncbi:MAG: diguanylate cyclase [Alphaproteobacteria bacterium]|nr:diguanylate cyclase [Alphaproteobacteria bacterium]
MISGSAENLKYIFSTIKSSFLPAFILLSVLLVFYAGNPYTQAAPLLLHYLFLFVSASTIGLLYIANQSKPLFSLGVGLVCYIIINRLKAEYGEAFISCPEFQCLCFLLPVNFALLYFLPQSKLNAARNIYLLFILLLQAVIAQHFCDLIKSIPHIDITVEAIPLWSCVIWVTMLAPLAISVSFKNTIINTGQFYADTSLFMGIIYAGNQSGLTTFFLGFSLILLCVTVLDLYRRYHYDYLEHVGSKTSYLANANSKFPFKYTIALFSIDNRDKLQQINGKEKIKNLEQLVVNSIIEMPYKLTLYRHNDAELIMVFKNEDARHAKEYADNIRHNIAASEFILTGNKNIKITISVCVSEKTRKDRNATEVVERAHNALQKSYRYNCNVTTVA